jgi:hypothetical protein
MASGAPVTEIGLVVANATMWWPQDHEETVELRWPDSVTMYDRMRRQDSTVRSSLQAVKLPIQRTTWRIDPNGARPLVVEACADELGLPIVGGAPRPVLRTRDRFSWADHLRLALLKLDFGHSFFEQTYRIDASGFAHIRKLGWRPPRTISRVVVARDGGLEAIWQYGVGEAIPVSQLVAYVNEREGGNWLGQSLIRPAYKPWMLKDRALRVQAQTLDRNGLGIPVYEAGAEPDYEGLQPEDRQKAVQAEMDGGAKLAQAYRSGDNSGAAIRNGSKLTLMGVTGTLPDSDKPIRYYDEQISAAVLANFLSLGGDNATGSYALGKTFAEFFVQSLQTLALDIADVATMHIVEDFVDLNFGTDEPAPRIVFDEIGAQQLATAQAIKMLIDCGALRADDPLETFLRERYTLPAADPATSRIAPTPTPTPPAQGA